MPTIAITDTTGVTTNVEIRADSPLAQAGLTQIVSTAASLAGSLIQPVDQAPVQTVVLGAAFNDPSFLISGAATLALSAAANAQLTLFKPADKTLFGADPFAPTITIGPQECWIGFEIDANVAGALTGTADGFGVGIAAASAVSLATYTRIAPAGTGFPTFLDAVAQALANYRVSCSAAAIRGLPAGTVTASDLGGSLTFSGSYSLPVSVNALATANLPLNHQIALNPSVTLQVVGQIALAGDFHVRSYKPSETQLVLGVYKKKATTLTATLTAGAKLEADLGKTDLLAAVMGTVFPGVDPAQEGVTGDTAAALKTVLQQGLDRSLSIAANLACSASFADEAAVVYAIDLAGGDSAATDAAISAALAGDWTGIDALPNAEPLRNIVRHTQDFQHKFAINLLGIYNAVSVADFVKSCTILHDGDGRIVITDQASASRIRAAAAPFLADPDKLRTALAEAFLATVTYTASAGSDFAASLSASQTYFLYDNQLTRQEMKDAVLLGEALGLIRDSVWDGVLAANPLFRHARIEATAQYDNAAALRLFFADPTARTLRARADLVRQGRTVMMALIDPADPAGMVRRSVLANDAAWQAMDESGNPAQFQFIGALSGLGPTQLGAVTADWTAIAWWADAMEKIGPALAGALAGTGSPDFMKKRQKLAGLLASVTRNTHAAFVGGWGLAVMFALSGAAKATLDISSDGNSRHYGS